MVGHLAEDEPGKRLKGARSGFQALLNLLPVKPLQGSASLDFAGQCLSDGIAKTGDQGEPRLYSTLCFG